MQKVAWVAAFHPIHTTVGEIRCSRAFPANPVSNPISGIPTELTILGAVLISGQIDGIAGKRLIWGHFSPGEPRQSPESGGKNMHRKLTDEELRRASAGSPELESRPRKCSKCGQEFRVTDHRLLPFCSLRCQQMDLAGWLDEEYGLPFEGDKSGQVVDYLDEESQN